MTDTLGLYMRRAVLVEHDEQPPILAQGIWHAQKLQEQRFSCVASQQAGQNESVRQSVRIAPEKFGKIEKILGTRWAIPIVACPLCLTPRHHHPFNVGRVDPDPRTPGGKKKVLFDIVPRRAKAQRIAVVNEGALVLRLFLQAVCVLNPIAAVKREY